jgi:hypothetical protein
MSLHRDIVARFASTAEIVAETAVLDHNEKHARGEASQATAGTAGVELAGNR